MRESKRKLYLFYLLPSSKDRFALKSNIFLRIPNAVAFTTQFIKNFNIV